MGDRKILVVDDEQSVLDVLTLVLTEWGEPRGISVIGATSAAEAFLALEGQAASVDLIVSDLNMPAMRGSDFLLAVKDRYPDIATMIVSGGGDMAELRRVIGAGVFSFLLKPCEPAALTAEVEKALELSHLKRENTRYQHRIREELRWAGDLQRALLNTEPVADARLAVQVTYIPLPEMQCGGDYYDILSISPDRTMFLIGDVGGHGIRAALITSMLKSIVSANREAASPRGLLDHLNVRLHSDLKRLPDVIVTFLACLLDTSTLTIACANAGHLPAFIIRQQKVVRVLPDGIGLGFSRDACYEEMSVPITHGDMLVLCTDGLTEGIAASPADAETRLCRILLACAGEAQYNPAVIDSLKREMGKNGFADDATLLSVRVT